MHGLVSILIPLFNVERYLTQCLDSVINQTYKNLQIVIVDDGSTDKTFEIARSYTEKDSRIELYHQENKGVAAARNELLRHIKGEYFLFVDSDDWIEINAIDLLMSSCLSHNADICVCDLVTHTPTIGESPSIECWSTDKIIHEFLCHESFNGSLWNKLIKTSLVKGGLFNPDISYGEDALFLWKIIQSANALVYNHIPLYNYRMNDGSISHKEFGASKFSGHLVWKEIVKDSESLWPHYSFIAKARWAVQDTLLIRDAAHSHYPIDRKIKALQETVKKYHKFIKRANISTWRMRLYSFVICRFYIIAHI